MALEGRRRSPDPGAADLGAVLVMTRLAPCLLMASAQLHLLWMSQRGWNEEYVKRVRRYLATLDRLIPGNDRVAKMHKFLRDTLSKVAPKS